MIIWLASYPRSGNTLLRIILNAAFDARSYSQHNDAHDIGADPATADAVGHLPLNAPWEQSYPALRDAAEPVFVKTHERPADDAKAIYVVRDGRSACVSFHHYLKDFGDGVFTPSLADVILGFTHFGSWGSHLDDWDPTRRPNTLLLKYEDIVADPSLTIRRIAEFTGLTPVRTWENNFDELHRINPKFFRAGASSTPASLLSPDDEALFLDHHSDWMAALGYQVAPANPDGPSPKALRSTLSQRGKQFFALLDGQRDLKRQIDDAWVHAQASANAATEVSAQLTATAARADALQSRLAQAEQDAARLRDAAVAAHDFATATRAAAADLTQRSQGAETRLMRLRRLLAQADRRATRAEARLAPFLRSRIYQSLWAVGAVRKPDWVDQFIAASSRDAQSDRSVPPAPPPGGEGLAAASAALERLGADAAQRLAAAIAGDPPPASDAAVEPLPPKPTEMDHALRHLVADKGFRPRVVLDVGSAKGYWTEHVSWYYFRDANFFMIDPLPTSEEHLKELAARSPQYHYILTAVGSQPGELVMNLTPDADGSSLLEFHNADPARQRVVPIETLDRLLAAGRIQPPNLVKIDVQGYEMEVLRGAAEILRTAEVFIIEVNLFEFMPKTPLVHEIVAFMADHGFRVYDFAGFLRRPHQEDLGQMDIVFVAKNSPLIASNRWA